MAGRSGHQRRSSSDTYFQLEHSSDAGRLPEYYVPPPYTKRQQALFGNWNFPAAEDRGASYKLPSPVSPKTRPVTLSGEERLRSSLPQYTAPRSLCPTAMNFQPRDQAGPSNQPAFFDEPEDDPLQFPNWEKTDTATEEADASTRSQPESSTQTTIDVSDRNPLPLTAPENCQENSNLTSSSSLSSSRPPQIGRPTTATAPLPPQPQPTQPSPRSLTPDEEITQPQYIPLTQDDGLPYPKDNSHMDSVRGLRRSKRPRVRAGGLRDRRDVGEGREGSSSGRIGGGGGRSRDRRRGRWGGGPGGRGRGRGDRWNPGLERERQREYLGRYSVERREEAR